MKRYDLHIRIIDRETDAAFMQTHLAAERDDALEILDGACTWLEVCDDGDGSVVEEAEPSEAQLQRMARGDHYPDYTYTMAEARKLK